MPWKDPAYAEAAEVLGRQADVSAERICALAVDGARARAHAAVSAAGHALRATRSPGDAADLLERCAGELRDLHAAIAAVWTWPAEVPT